MTDESISIGKGFGPWYRSQILEAKKTKRNSLSAHPSKTPPFHARNRDRPTLPADKSTHGRRTQRLSQTKSAIARGITSAYEYQIATTLHHDMTTLISISHNNSELSSLHAGPAGRKRGRTKQQVQRTPIEYISSNEETSFADQSNYPNHRTYLTLDSKRTNTMTTNGSRTSFGITSSNAPGTNARTNSGTSRESPAAEGVPATHTLRDIHAEAAAEYNEGGSGEYPSPQTPPSSSSRQQLLHYLVTNWKSLALGQVLSILLSTAGITQSTLYASCGLSAPTLSVAFVYLINSFHLCRLRNRRCRGERLSVDADIDDDWSARLETIEESNSGNSSSTAKASASKGAEILRMSSQPTHTFCGLQINAPPWIVSIHHADQCYPVRCTGYTICDGFVEMVARKGIWTYPHGWRGPVHGRRCRECYARLQDCQ